MRNPEVAARMVATKIAEGTLSNPYKNTVEKYGVEIARKLNSRPGNRFGAGNKGSIKTNDHKNKIAASISKMYTNKKESGEYVAPTGRHRALDYSIIIATVKQLGFKDAAKELNLSVASLKGRYYNAVKVQDK